MLVIDSTTLTRTLNLLRKKGWVRTVPGEDRRERHHELTRSGRKLCERAFRAWERAQERLRGKLGSSDWQALQSVLGRITRAALDA
jgi:DNA-binding MarR family transcriptional regulator